MDVADAADVPHVTRSPPRWLALAGACETLRLPLRVRLPLFRVKYVGCDHHRSSARRELGDEPRVRIEERLPGVVRGMVASPPGASGVVGSGS